MGQNRSKYSQHGANARRRVDIAALSPVARRQATRVIPVGDFTQSSTVKYSRGPLGMKGTLKAAYYSARTLPIGGTLSLQIKAYDASANTEIALTNTLDPEAGVAREGSAFVLATTNVALDADDVIELHEIADGSAVSQQVVDGYVTLVFERTEDTTIVD